ncbi:hypothetical protein [Methylobacillus sp. Pita1]|uniref:hypothetical protein n=1 Tax=Methylobacillus sp. Pita1 TaxID=3382642 RepID=UPI0038B551B0
MKHHEMTVTRAQGSWSIRWPSVGTDALNALYSIPIVIDAHVILETGEFVAISYVCEEGKTFWATEEVLARFNLRRL